MCSKDRSSPPNSHLATPLLQPGIVARPRRCPGPPVPAPGFLTLPGRCHKQACGMTTSSKAGEERGGEAREMRMAVTIAFPPHAPQSDLSTEGGVSDLKPTLNEGGARELTGRRGALVSLPAGRAAGSCAFGQLLRRPPSGPAFRRANRAPAAPPGPPRRSDLNIAGPAGGGFQEATQAAGAAHATLHDLNWRPGHRATPHPGPGRPRMQAQGATPPPKQASG